MTLPGERYDARESGILMPFRALHGDHDHQGTLGAEAVEFLDCMQEAGFSVLHDLPCSPPDPFDSPYSSVSAFAIDPQRIDLYQLTEAGDINRFALDRYQKLVQAGDAGPAIREEKDALLRQAFRGFIQDGSPDRHEAFARWCGDEAQWLDSFAAYEILKKLPENSDWRWQRWGIGKDYSDELVADIKTSREEDFLAISYQQWTVHEQTMRYLDESGKRGIKIWGDVPFYVNGGEVWANRDIFNLDADGNQLNQGGAAPSMTSATGQMWGFPTYKADGLENPEQTAKVVDWYTRRLMRAHKLTPGRVRLDHFIGWAEPYIIAADAKDGMNGYRDVGIGRAVLRRLTSVYGNNLPFYPEDLGTQTDATPELRDEFGLDRNTLLVRSFTKHLILGEYDESFHNPDNHHYGSVNISSNHDSPTFIQALDMVRTEFPQEFGHYVMRMNEKFPNINLQNGTASERIAQLEMERLAHSVGRCAIFGMWDVVGLGPEGRYNVPNTISPANWSWRMGSDDMSAFRSRLAYWRFLNESSGRASQVMASAAD